MLNFSFFVGFSGTSKLPKYGSVGVRLISPYPWANPIPIWPISDPKWAVWTHNSWNRCTIWGHFSVEPSLVCRMGDPVLDWIGDCGFFQLRVIAIVQSVWRLSALQTLSRLSKMLMRRHDQTTSLKKSFKLLALATMSLWCWELLISFWITFAKH